ncbi:MAG TPA: fumarylacetoacetase [Gemmatimonadales bacterium]
MPLLDETHDPSLQSWIPSANEPDTDFPIQNLPFGVFRRRGTAGEARVGVAIGDQVLDVAAAFDAELLDGRATAAVERCRQPALNGLMALGPAHRSALRLALSRMLRVGVPAGERVAADPALAARVLVPMGDAELLLPAEVGDYTDFYASVHHATNVGSMFRPDNPLLPNYKWVPIGYHGRASSLVPSGTAVRRPVGQVRAPDASAPTVVPSRLLDYELEVGAFIGPGNALGEPIPVADAEEHIFGLCLVNDWSARDIQAWEYQPLGPFLAKSFATTVSPWVVTMEALAPFRRPAPARPEGDPEPLDHLRQDGAPAVDVTLEVLLRTARMREAGDAPARLSRTSFLNMYWTFGQMVAHHSSNGCNLRPGDLLASGTVSGPGRDERGCLLELTRRGAEPVTLPNGETRKFLEEGDEVMLRGWCEAEGARRIGFGSCEGKIEGL